MPVTLTGFRWVLSQILPYPGAKGAKSGLGQFPGPLRQIVHDLI